MSQRSLVASVDNFLIAGCQFQLMPMSGQATKTDEFSENFQRWGGAWADMNAIFRFSLQSDRVEKNE